MTANDDYTRPLAGSAALVLTDVQRDFLDVPGEDPAMPVAGRPGAAAIDRARRPNRRTGQRRLADCRGTFTTPILTSICAKAAATHWFSRDVTFRTALVCRSTRHPNATSELSWCPTRSRAYTTGAFTNVAPKGVEVLGLSATLDWLAC
jgi:hypothetical protein